MDQDKSILKSLASAGAATAVAGLVLYAVGQTLHFLFRDVDPDKVEHEAVEELKAEEPTEEQDIKEE